MRHWINYAGQDLKDFGVYISGSGTFDAPERDVKTVAIPGRNGELTLDNGRYKNIKVKYPAFIYKEFANNAEGLREWLLSQKGYQRLEDTYNPDEYRLARYSGGFNVKPLDELVAGNFDLVFDCKPQRFLKSGEEYMSVSNGDQLLNPTLMTALPLLYVSIGGSGTHSVQINSDTVTISAFGGVIIDCELQEAYSSLDPTLNFNQYITLSNGKFPSLIAGVNSIAIVNCTLQIMPRWWRL